MKKGIAMIELILAIMVMSIAMLAAPKLISQSQQGIIIGIKQEAIAGLSSNIEMIMSLDWDEAGTNDSIYPTISIASGSGSDELNEKDNTGRRAGTPLESKRSFYSSMGDTFDASINFSEGDFDDIDDFNGKETTLTLVEGSNTKTGDYVDKDLKMNTVVRYLLDTPTGGTFNANILTYNPDFSGITVVTGIPPVSTNVKGISTVLETDNTNNNHRKKIRLRGFSSNIGSFEIDTKEF